MSHAPGWYPSGSGIPGEKRWWDGHAWTGDFDPPRPFTEADLWTPPLGSSTRETAIDLAPQHRADARPPLPTPPHPGARNSVARRWGGIVAGACAAIALWAGLDWLTDGGGGLPPASARAMLDVSTTMPATVEGDGLEAAEAFAATLPRSRDDNGSYVTTAATMADAFGSELEWHEYASYGMCSTGDHGDAEFVLAAYCPLDPGAVLLNSSNESYPDFLYYEAFVDVVAHELAHKIIDRRCGSTDPQIDGAHYEGVTNSYAVAFLGANPDHLAVTMSGFEEYAMTPETDAAAARIHEGDCSS